MNSSLSSRFRIREDLVLVEDVVADRRLQEQIGLALAGELAVTVEQVEELRLERRAGPIGVEVGEKRVLGVFEDGGASSLRASRSASRVLPDPDRAFDGEIVKGHCAAEYSL